MSEPSKQLIRDYIQRFWNEGDADALLRLTAPNFKFNCEGVAYDRDQLIEIMRITRHALPDWCSRIVDIIAEGDIVAIRCETSATHLGDYNGIRPSGKTIAQCASCFYRIDDGKIAQEWEQSDTLATLLINAGGTRSA